MDKMTIGKNLFKGHLASISRNGWLWMSKLSDLDFIGNCNYATVSHNVESDCLEIFPFNAPGYWNCQPDEFSIREVEDNGVIILVAWLKEFADKRGLYGQYIPNYDKEKGMIRINLEERVKKYGK